MEVSEIMHNSASEVRPFFQQPVEVVAAEPVAEVAVGIVTEVAAAEEREPILAAALPHVAEGKVAAEVAVVSTQRHVGATIAPFLRWHLDGARFDRIFLYFDAPEDDADAMAIARGQEWADRVTVFHDLWQALREPTLTGLD